MVSEDRNTRRRIHHISDPRVKFGAIRSELQTYSFHDALIETKSALHISKIRFLLPVSFTIEYKVGIAEFYLYMGFGANLLKNVVTRT